MASLSYQVERTATRLGLPGRLVVALAHALSRLQPAVRYDPNYDAQYVVYSATWKDHPEYIVQGPTADQWFEYHPDRRIERQTDRDYTFIAQDILAVQYGPLMLYYPEAIKQGYVDAPEHLKQDIEVPITTLREEFEWAATRLRDESTALRVAIARYNGHHIGNTDPERLDNIDTVKAVETSYRLLFGCAFWTRL